MLIAGAETAGAWDRGCSAYTTGPVTASLREVLAELVWQGVAEATVVGPDGQGVGRITLGSILAHGRQAS